MNLRLRDNLLFWTHRGLAAAGRIHAPSLEEIRAAGFQRILVVATTAIGDAILCTPLIESLRQALPQAHLGFWVSAAAAPLFRAQRGLDARLVYHGKYRQVRATLRALRTERFDLALVANANDPDVIPLLWWSGCRRIIRRPQRNTIYRFMIANPDMLSVNHTEGHAIERNLQFCDLLGLPRGVARTRLDVDAAAVARLGSRLEGDTEPWIVIHPGSSRSRKQWGAANYAALARRLQDLAGGTLLITGNRAERPMGEAILEAAGPGLRARNLAGEIGLDEMAALLREARLLVSGDTGAYHIAMAVGTASVTLFAPWDIGSSPSINGPFFDRERHLVVETARMGDPISTLRGERVLAACESLIQGKSA